MHDLAEKAFWSSIQPSTSRFDVQFLSEDLRCFQFDRCQLHARGHVQHDYKLTCAFATTVAPAMSSAVLLGCDIGAMYITGGIDMQTNVNRVQLRRHA